MSAELKEKDSQNHYSNNELHTSKKVNLTDLMQRMNTEKKRERKSNIILSAAAVSAVAVFGIILTL
ncbi:hypothetical protein OAN27_00235 [Pelagibacteraceae bacterium]|nr:hypothetical protein [Pelagibacteraceae bacterium]